MPTDWLPVPHHKQSRSGACLQACARMLLSYLGQDLSEDRLGKLLDSRTFGTPARNIRRLETLGVTVAYGPANLSHLRALLQRGIPSIVFLQAGQLPYWKEDSYHAVVVVGMTADTIYLNDPAFDQAPQSCPLDGFSLAWSDFDYLHATITP